MVAITKLVRHPRMSVVTSAVAAFTAVVRHPVMAAGVSALAVITGLLGSLFADQIRNALSFVFELAPAGGPVWWFWGSFIAFFLLFVLRQHILDSDRKSLLSHKLS